MSFAIHGTWQRTILCIGIALVVPPEAAACQRRSLSAELARLEAGAPLRLQLGSELFEGQFDRLGPDTLHLLKDRIALVSIDSLWAARPMRIHPGAIGLSAALGAAIGGWVGTLRICGEFPFDPCREVPFSTKGMVIGALAGAAVTAAIVSAQHEWKRLFP